MKYLRANSLNKLKNGLSQNNRPALHFSLNWQKVCEMSIKNSQCQFLMWWMLSDQLRKIHVHDKQAVHDRETQKTGLSVLCFTVMPIVHCFLEHTRCRSETQTQLPRTDVWLWVTVSDLALQTMQLFSSVLQQGLYK